MQTEGRIKNKKSKITEAFTAFHVSQPCWIFRVWGQLGISDFLSWSCDFSLCSSSSFFRLRTWKFQLSSTNGVQHKYPIKQSDGAMKTNLGMQMCMSSGRASLYHFNPTYFLRSVNLSVNTYWHVQIVGRLKPLRLFHNRRRPVLSHFHCFLRNTNTW